MLYTDYNKTDLACYIFHIHQQISIILAENSCVMFELSSAYLIYHVRLLWRP